MKAPHEFQSRGQYEEYLRTYFAALAMQGLVSKYNLNTPEDQKTISQLSVELAGELINELNK